MFTNKKTPLTALALELYGATDVPGVGPGDVAGGGDVWSLACTLQYIARSATAAPIHTPIY